jgi:hypothetical protein
MYIEKKFTEVITYSYSYYNEIFCLVCKVKKLFVENKMFIELFWNQNLLEP